MESVLILGATGMLGRALVAEARRRNFAAVGLARTGAGIDADIADGDLLTATVARVRPHIVINSAAMTSIDACENDPGRAYAVNARPAALLAPVADRLDTYFVQVSTDHFFTGDGARRHGEADSVTLVNEYARTKFAGERFTLTNSRALVVRTNVVGFRYRPGEPTFAEWVLQSLQQRHPITLFDDFFTSSIDVWQFAGALFDILPMRPCGILNIASSQVSSKKAFVDALAARLGLAVEQCASGTVRSLQGVPRAESLGLDVARAEHMLGRPLPDLASVVERLARQYREAA